MSQYLTQEWLDEFCELSGELPERPGATLKIQYQVTGAPDGDLDYYLNHENGKLVEGTLGSLEDPDTTITMSYDDAAAMQRGDLDATAAFMQGKMKAAGNMARLMSLLPVTNSPEWKALQEKVKANTQF